MAERLVVIGNGMAGIRTIEKLEDGTIYLLPVARDGCQNS